MPKESYPGRRTREQWRALPRKAREDLAERAQCTCSDRFAIAGTNDACARARAAAAIRAPAAKSSGA
jgi:hypothetical protein